MFPIPVKLIFQSCQNLRCNGSSRTTSSVSTLLCFALAMAGGVEADASWPNFGAPCRAELSESDQEINENASKLKRPASKIEEEDKTKTMKRPAAAKTEKTEKTEKAVAPKVRAKAKSKRKATTMSMKNAKDTGDVASEAASGSRGRDGADGGGGLPMASGSSPAKPSAKASSPSKSKPKLGCPKCRWSVNGCARCRAKMAKSD